MDRMCWVSPGGAWSVTVARAGEGELVFEIDAYGVTVLVGVLDPYRGFEALSAAMVDAGGPRFETMRIRPEPDGPAAALGYLGLPAPQPTVAVDVLGAGA